MSQSPWLELLEAVSVIDSRTAAVHGVAPGTPGSTQVAELFGAKLRALGFELEWADTLPEEGPRGRHLLARRNPAAPVRIVLIGHTDTVLAPVEAPFRVDAGAARVYGSGVCDMKGAVVLMLAALESALAEDQAVREAGLVVLLNCTEEIAGPSFRTLARAEAKGARACLGFEPARPGAKGVHEFVVARKGVVRFGLTCYGRAAHSGNDHTQGVNAIREVARKIEQVEALTDYVRQFTVNVGVIRGGHATNQVPDEVFVGFDTRAYEPAVLEAGCATIRRICAEPTVRSFAGGHTTRLELTEYHSYPPWGGSAAAPELAQAYVAAAARRGLTVTPTASGGGSDASHVADLAPTIDGLGILGSCMHRTDEWADWQTFELRARVAADLLRQVCQAPRKPRQ